MRALRRFCGTLSPHVFRGSRGTDRRNFLLILRCGFCERTFFARAHMTLAVSHLSHNGGTLMQLQTKLWTLNHQSTLNTHYCTQDFKFKTCERTPCMSLNFSL